MDTDPEIWGPHYWYVIHFIAFNYPNYPDATHKKIIYRFFTNLTHLMPNGPWISKYQNILKDNPILPYLDSKENLIKWTNHIHNIYNIELNKPIVSLKKMYADYYSNIKTKKKIKKKNKINYNNKKKINLFIFIFILLFLIIIAIYLYKK
tara:strand:+ start:1514 stop:1963 length:450 start_codon:yes stop_codon:yes gene_type:complete